jgi:hypothetical protein
MCKIRDKDKSWAPHIVCINCEVYLRGWLKSSWKSTPFAVPMVWRGRKKIDRLLLLFKISGIPWKYKHSIQYPSLPSAVRLMLHSQDLPSPKPPEKWTADDDNNDGEPVPMEHDISNPDFHPSSSNEPHLASNPELSNFVRDLNLSGSQAEFLASRLQGWSLLHFVNAERYYSVFCFSW